MFTFKFENGNAEVLDVEYGNKFIEFMFVNDGNEYKIKGYQVEMKEIEFDYWIKMYEMKREIDAMFEELSCEDQQEVEEQITQYTISDIEQELKLYKALVKERL